MLSIGPIRNVILLGGWPTCFPVIKSFCETRAVNCIIITSPDQRNAAPTMPADIVTNDLSSAVCADALSGKLIEGEKLALSFGARWIIDKQTRNSLFDGLVLN